VLFSGELCHEIQNLNNNQMKKSTIIFALFFIASLSVFAQKTLPMVDSKGHILNGNKQIGTMTAAGSFDQSGKSMTKVDGKGNIVDVDGKVIGKAPKNGEFVYYFKDNQEKYSIEKPDHDGMCKVKNAKGETVVLMHNNYKQEPACVVHCLHENHCMPNEMPAHKH
jgi:hypothetical protein